MASSLTTRYSNKTYGCATVKRSERFKRLKTIAKSKIERSDNHDNQQICTLQPKAIDSTNFSEYGQVNFTTFLTSNNDFISYYRSLAGKRTVKFSVRR